MKYCRLILVGSFLAFAQLVSAQAPPPGGGGSGGGNTSAPVDGASGILLIAAAAYGYNRLRKQETTITEERSK